MKLGLALSGGGFRAALFHVGVLARMAELGLLAKVQVLSTVSGGSIVGALYYLHVLRLLESEPSPTSRHYVEIVQAVERELLRGIQRNLRLRIFHNPMATARILITEDYSRTARIGEIYERELYRTIWDEILQLRQLPRTGKPIPLRGLIVDPASNRGVASLRSFNATAPAFPIPDLVMNATSLNSGRYWRFSATKFGESLTRDDIRDERRDWCSPLDATAVESRQESHYYRFDLRPNSREIPPSASDITLGMSVGASSAVPGIFTPVALHGFYKEKGTAHQLVDGGVFDNQGLHHLLQEKCSHVIVSDGAAYFEEESSPATGIIGVPLRANDIMMKRLRGLELDGLRRQLGAVRQSGDGYVPAGVSEMAFFFIRQPACGSSVFTDRDLAAMAAIRTDLDSFSDIEAHCLAYHGYEVAGWGIGRYLAGALPSPTPAPPGTWRFTGILAKLSSDRALVRRHLKVGRNRWGRILCLYGQPEGALAWLALFAMLGLLGAGLWYAFKDVDFTPASRWAYATVFGAIASVIAGLIAEQLKLKWVWKVVSVFRRLPGLLWATAALSIVPWLISTIRLNVFDRLFLKAGRLT